MHGAIFSGVDVRDYKIVCASGAYNFSPTFELKPGRVKDQGSTGSCVAHSLSSIIEYYNNTQRNDQTEMSVGYIYGNRTTSNHKGPGMIMRDALEVARNFGDVPYKDFPHNEETPIAISLYQRKADELYGIGRPNRISEYCRINSVTAAKLALTKGIPLLMAMEWYSDMKVVNGVLRSEFIGNEGGHCMFIYGWNETGWLVQNSWGEDWGVNGRFTLPYEMGMAECWAVMDYIVEDVQIKKPFTSKPGKFFAKIINSICNVFHHDE